MVTWDTREAGWLYILYTQHYNRKSYIFILFIIIHGADVTLGGIEEYKNPGDVVESA